MRPCLVLCVSSTLDNNTCIRSHHNRAQHSDHSNQHTRSLAHLVRSSRSGTLQPIITILAFVHNFGLLNLAIERDIDQDIVEMNIRLTFSDSHVPNWLLQQMVCLERLDGRAFSLPANLIPSIDMSRAMATNFIASLLFVGPYLLSIYGQLTSELVCPVEKA